jgi:hypothetical protein
MSLWLTFLFIIGLNHLIKILSVELTKQQVFTALSYGYVKEKGIGVLHVAYEIMNNYQPLN